MTVTLSTLEDVRQLLRDGTRIGLGGFWFVRNPTRLVEAVLDSGATDLEVVCFGGGLPLERLLRERRVSTLYFSFNSLDVLGPAPAFRQALESGKVKGVELTTLVMAKALRAAEENLPFLPIRGPEESAFVDGLYPLPPLESPVSGDKLRAVPALPIDVTLVHATRGDTEGNVEIVGARGLDLRLLGAAKHRVVSVEALEPAFRGPSRAHRSTVARFLIDHLVEAPGGALPSSCLPDYATDLAAISEEVGRPARVDPAPMAPTAHVSSASEAEPPTNAEFLVTYLARQLVDGGVYTVGSVTPVSMVAYQLAKRTHAPRMTIIPFAGLVDVDFYPVGVGTSEELALEHSHGFWGMEDLYERLYQAGRIDAEIFCPAQIDHRADINNSMASRDGKPVRLPGQAGIADVAAMHKNLYMYLPRHSPTRLVESLDFPGGSRYLVGDDERREAGFQPGEVTIVTDLCVLRQNKGTRLLEVESLHPGVTADQVHEATGFDLHIADDVARTVPPTAEELALLRTVIDPHHVRDIETVASADRGALIHEILQHELAQRKVRCK